MTPVHANSRLEAFCDAVFAIALTLLILEVRLPEGHIASTADFWRALQHVLPSVFAFVLSFGIILITWVNHHAAMKLVRSSCASFIYANGLLLLAVVSIPFPTSLLGEFIWTDYAAPAVVLYNSVLALLALGWILIERAVLKNQLIADEASITMVRNSHANGYVAFAFYLLLAIAAFWLPRVSAILTTASWMFWLVFGIRMKHV
jgi:uncharacterized membrane protein